MKVNIQKRKRIFKGAILSLVLCSIVLAILAPGAYAATTGYAWCEVLATINVRNGPGLGNDVVTQYTKGTKFICWEDDYVQADGYKWYQCPDGWIAQTGGLKFYIEQVAYDVITCYDPYGEVRWEHDCEGNGNPNWGYHLTVDDEGYRVNCDCGWGEYYYVGYAISDDGDGTTKLVFIGLDTDNDEIVDLRPGQSKFLPNRATSDLRQYQILEFLDDPDKQAPVVNLIFRDGNNKLLAVYTFNWSVEVHVEDYGVVMVGNDGLKKIHYVDGDFLLLDEISDVYLADTPRIYDVFVNYGTKVIINDYGSEWGIPFILAPVGDGGWGPIEWVVHIVRSIADFVVDLFDFFGLSFIFSDEDSPFRFLIGG